MVGVLGGGVGGGDGDNIEMPDSNCPQHMPPLASRTITVAQLYGGAGVGGGPGGPLDG